MTSYWEKESFSYYDHIVAGAGIVGLSVAIELKTLFPEERVLVVERGLLPTGASTRNAGFACMGSVTELLDDLEHMPASEVAALFQLRKHGLELLRGRLGDNNIGYQANGSYELIGDNETGVLEHIDMLNELMMPTTGQAAFRIANGKITALGLNKDHTKALIENTCEGELHSGKMMRALTDFAINCGIEIKTGADIRSFEDEGKQVALIIKDGFRDGDWLLRCNTFSICTNAFTNKLLPDTDVTPGRGQVLITKPIPGLKLKGIFHFDKGYYYFREIDGRVLFGGGRNLDFARETTTNFELNSIIQDDLEQKMRNIILPGTPFKVDMRWAGIMAFGANKQPIVRQFSANVFGAFRMGGMGVAIGSVVAKDLVEIIAQNR